MFETLEDQIKIDEEKATPKSQRMIRWVLIALLSVILFGSLYFGIQLFGGS